jgi:aspartate carbamoyltransferase catalytic subunit
MGVDVHWQVDEAVEGADVVMVLRIQLERQKDALFPTLREYAKVFGVNSSRLSHAKDGAMVMHPGPMNRGVEIAQDVADGPYSVILQQVTNGVAIRMAVLYLLSGVEEPKASLVEQ